MRREAVEAKRMIRAIGPDDRAAWTELWRGYLEFYETVLPDEIYDVTWSRLHDPAETIRGALALDEAGTPIGLAHYIFHRHGWMVNETCYLQDLYVAPHARGGGHGRALIDFVADRARERGAGRLYWLTHETNTAAQKLYDVVAQRSGFIQYRKAL
jgi:GNAT superfamily N-acetyltransferase